MTPPRYELGVVEGQPVTVTYARLRWSGSVPDPSLLRGLTTSTLLLAVPAGAHATSPGVRHLATETSPLNSGLASGASFVPLFVALPP